MNSFPLDSVRVQDFRNISVSVLVNDSEKEDICTKFQQKSNRPVCINLAKRCVCD